MTLVYPLHTNKKGKMGDKNAHLIIHYPRLVFVNQESICDKEDGLREKMLGVPNYLRSVYHLLKPICRPVLQTYERKRVTSQRHLR